VYKVRYATPVWLPGTKSCDYLCGCHGNSVTLHDPPLLFDMVADPSEDHPLDTTLPKHKAMIAQINAAVDEFKSTLSDDIVNQFGYSETARTSLDADVL
jgi:hypothetical protein